MEKNGYTGIKNDAAFHPLEGDFAGSWREPEDWKGFEDTQLRSMLVRLGTKNPEKYTTRRDMIDELSMITEVLDGDKPLLDRGDWQGYTDPQLRNMLVRLGTKNPETYGTRLEMISKLDEITKIVGRNRSVLK